MDDQLEGTRRRMMPGKVSAPAGNNKIVTRAQTYFEMQAQKGKLDAETTKAIQQGDMQFFDADYYVRKQINAGQTEILNSGNVKRVGTSNLDKNVLPELVNFVLDRVRLAWGTDAGTNVAAVNFSNAGSIPAAIANGELQILLDDRPIVDIPASRFFINSATATPNAVQGVSDTVQLESRRLIKPGQPLTILFKCAEGITLPTGNHFVEVRLMGASNRKR